jgi:integron integrase
MEIPSTPPKKLLDRVRDALRLKHYSYRTEQTYVQWIRRFILFHNKRHPQESGCNRAEVSSACVAPSMGVPEIEAFLTYLAVQENVTASTQNQAFSALLFLYRHVLEIELDERIEMLRARRTRYIPTVLTPTETKEILSHLSGVYRLLAILLYGSGLRLQEVLQLRVKDLDISQQQIVVRDSKGREGRVTVLPESAIALLQQHLQQVKKLHLHDLNQGYGATQLPFALDKKYINASRDWIWQYVFPSFTLSKDPRTGKVLRYHLHPSGLQKAVKQAVRSTNIQKRVSCHTFRHSFATHLLPKSSRKAPGFSHGDIRRAKRRFRLE